MQKNSVNRSTQTLAQNENVLDLLDNPNLRNRDAHG